MNTRKFIYFGPLTVIIEWIGFGLVVNFTTFQSNRAFSLLTVAPEPLPRIFGITLTLAGISYWLFTMPLSIYSRYIPRLGAIAGLGLAITGWLSFSGDGGAKDILHNMVIYTATIANIMMVWLMRHHPRRSLSRFSIYMSGLLVLAVIISFYSEYIIHRYIAYLQIVITALFQLWVMFLAFHEHRVLRES